MNNRQQYVLYNSITSTSLGVHTGVPQGSVLGPVLFLLYVNDLPSAIDDSLLTIQFADDTSVTAQNHNLNDLLTNVKEAESMLKDWFLSNQLCLNSAKTENMVFTLREMEKVESIEPVRFLGVFLDPKLAWDHHTDYICKKISKNTYLLRNLSHVVSIKTLITAYHSLIHSVISYGILVWGHASTTASVFSIQRRVIRIMCGLKFRDDCRQKFIQHKILTVPCTYIFHCLIHVKNNLNSYNVRNEIHEHYTRNRDLLEGPYLRLTKTRNGTAYWGVTLFNALSPEVKILNIRSFKYRVKKYLLLNAFYSIQQFLSSDVALM